MRPGRGASLRNPARRRARKRSLQSWTVDREISSACAMLSLRTPSPTWSGVITAYQGNTLHEKGLTTLLDELESLSDAAAKRLVGKINSTVSPKLFVLLGNLSIGSRPFEQVRLTWMLAEREYCNGRCFSMRWNWRRSQSGEPKPRASRNSNLRDILSYPKVPLSTWVEYSVDDFGRRRELGPNPSVACPPVSLH